MAPLTLSLWDLICITDKSSAQCRAVWMKNEDMLGNYSGMGRSLGLGSSPVVYRPEQQAEPRMQRQVSECLVSFVYPMPFPPTQLCPCPARKGEAAPGYARNAAGSSVQQEERAACYPESGQRGPAARLGGAVLLSFSFPRFPSSWEAQEAPLGLPQPTSKCLGSASPQGSKSKRWQLPGASSSSHCHELKRLSKEKSSEPQSIYSRASF